jgi:hypothetical protein
VKVDAMHAGRLLVETMEARRAADSDAAALGLEARAERVDPRVRMVAATVIDQQDPHASAASPRGAPSA